MVVVAGLRLPSREIPVPFQPIGQVGPSAIQTAGLGSWLDAKSAARLQELEKEMWTKLQISPVLLAWTEQGLQRAFEKAFKVAATYFIESAVIIWRALGHNHDKLRRLSQASCQNIEKELFRYSGRLENETFIKVVAGVRAWGRVGEWIIIADEKKKIDERLVDYLFDSMVTSFIVLSFLAYLRGEIKRARKSNLKVLAEALWETAERGYEDAIHSKLHEIASETQFWYWSPRYQEGEVEADLDRQLGRMKRLKSVDDLIQDLR